MIPVCGITKHNLTLFFSFLHITHNGLLFLFLVHITIPFSSASAHSMLTVWTDRTGEAEAAVAPAQSVILCISYILSNLRLDGAAEPHPSSIFTYIPFCCLEDQARIFAASGLAARYLVFNILYFFEERWEMNGERRLGGEGQKSSVGRNSKRKQVRGRGVKVVAIKRPFSGGLPLEYITIRRGKGWKYTGRCICCLVIVLHREHNNTRLHQRPSICPVPFSTITKKTKRPKSRQGVASGRFFGPATTSNPCPVPFQLANAQ